MTSVLEEFRLQSRFCGEFGSPFTQQLLARAADDIEAGGIVAKLTANWPGHPRADAVSLRVAGALHAAALTGRDAMLAVEYPHAKASWSMDRVWPLADDFLKREEDWVRAFMRSPPQTNETARSTGLACGFMWLADRMSQPFHMLELGASAGLNLNWDRFAYAHAPWGRAAVIEPFMPTQVEGAPPVWRDIAIASRAACDQNPLDPANADDRLRLRAYVWADQGARLERLNAAMELARETGVKVQKADAAAWVRERLAGDLPVGTTVVYHSVFFQYPPIEVRAAIAAGIEEAGARTREDRRLAWVRFEPESVLGRDRASTHYVLNAVTWENGQREEVTLADVDPHGRTMKWSS
ncbi:MAG: DUF2332 domain-containing protein [Hyphomonadaceae bacterium]